MKVIGHRGAAGLALENTLESIKAAKAAGVDAIEFDVRLTADGHFVLCHDVSTKRVSAEEVRIHESSLATLSNVILHNGEPLPTLDVALKTCAKTPVFLEVKGTDWAKKLASFLKDYETKHVSVIALNHQELAQFGKLMPKIETYAIVKFHSTEILETFKFAARSGFKGIDMNFWLLNPLTYRWAKQWNLRVVVYTVNSRLIARFLQRLFPEVVFTTNYPKRLLSFKKELQK